MALDQEKLFGLYAVDCYLRENPETATWNDIFNYLTGCGKLVRENSGDVDGFLDVVCSSFKGYFHAPDMVVEGLRQELEQAIDG